MSNKRTELKKLSRELVITLDGTTIAVEEDSGDITKVESKRGDFIVLHLETGTFAWNAPLDDYNDEVAVDPTEEPRWIDYKEFLNG